MRDDVSWGIFFGKAFTISLLVLGISYWQSGKIPRKFVAIDHLQKEPLQTKTEKTSFTVDLKGHRYQIDPLYEYEIWGLVVSDHSSDSWLDTSHESWNDYLNTKDICVIWGTNILSPHLNELKFSHGTFTCYVQTKSAAAWQSFHADKLANNHLIPASKNIEKLIANSRVGDEIRIKGQLVNYNVNGGPFRKTSVIRNDMENGACEIIYVNEFETLARNNKIWIYIFKFSKILSVLFLGVTLFFILVTPFFKGTE